VRGWPARKLSSYRAAWLSLARWDPAAGGLLDWAAATMRREQWFPRGYGPGLAAELLRTEREPRDNGLFRMPPYGAVQSEEDRKYSAICILCAFCYPCGLVAYCRGRAG
jgi:hypothetical protein